MVDQLDHICHGAYLICDPPYCGGKEHASHKYAHQDDIIIERSWLVVIVPILVDPSLRISNGIIVSASLSLVAQNGIGRRNATEPVVCVTRRFVLILSHHTIDHSMGTAHSGVRDWVIL